VNETANPPIAIATVHSNTLPSNNETRRILSVATPIGIVAIAATMLNAPASIPIAKCETPNSCSMLGANAPTAPLSA
jgi:hypothetical protein